MLSEPRRQQLDGIVQRMIDNKETDEDVQFVVNDFSQKYQNEANANIQSPAQQQKITAQNLETNKGFIQKFSDIGKGVINFFTKSEQAFGQTLGDTLAVFSKDYKNAAKSQESLDNLNQELGKKIVGYKRQGQDTSKLEALWRQNTGRIFKPEEIIPSMNKSAKQIYGEGLGVATDIASFGQYGGAFKPLSKIAGGTKGQAIIQGALHEVPKAFGIGAGYGASTAMQENKSNEDILKQSLISGGISSLVSGVIGGIQALKGFNAPARAEALKQKSIEQYKKGLAATKEKYKEKSDKIIPELLDKGYWGSKKSLIKKAEQGIALSQDEYQKLGELKGVLEIDGLVNKIDDEMNGLTLRSGRVTSVNQGKYKALQELKDDILALDAFDKIKDRKAFGEDLRQLAQDYGEDLYQARKSQKTIMDNKTLSQVKKVDSAIREMLNSKYPEYEKINKVFHLNTELAEILNETAQRESGGGGVMRKIQEHLTQLTLGGLGVGVGGGIGGSKGAIIAGLGLSAFATIKNSTWYNTWNAVRKSHLADKILEKSPEEATKWLTLIANQGIKKANEFINE